MKDLALEQKPDGSVPWVVPNVVKDGGGTGWSDGYGATGWADAAIVIPWEVYQAYGDKRILENQYESMKGWVDYMVSHAGDRYIFDFGFHFGDWLAFSEYMSYHFNAPDYGYAGAYTEKELIATAYFYYSTTLMWKIATILGENNDAERYAAILPKIKKAFQREFITETGRITSNSQTAYTLALSFGLYDETLHANGAQRLANDVKHFGHLTTGFLGTPLICKALSENGYADLAYLLLFNKRYPSWLYPITQGATTIWERWDCIKPDGSFQTVGMNSFNHYAFGAIGHWLYTRVAGLQCDPDQPGYKHIIIKPLLTDQLDYAEAKHQSLYGEVLSRWERKDNKMVITIEVPVNASATVFLNEPAGSITESGIPLPSQSSVSILKSDSEETIVAIGSGSYCFEYM
jgi:alpha-L-rhamnosidase